MVFRVRPARQSVFLAQTDSLSVARAEPQRDVVDLMPRLALARCRNCRIVGDTIHFGNNGVFELDVTQLLPSKNSVLSLVVDRDRAPVGLSVGYEIYLSQSPFESLTGVTLFRGRLVALDPSDVASRYTLRLMAPVTGGSIIRLSASNVALPLKYLILHIPRTNFTFTFPYPSIVREDIMSLWRLPARPTQYFVHFFWNSADGRTATLTYREGGVDVATFSTTSTSTVISGVGRVWRRGVAVSYSVSSNAVVKVFYVDFSFATPLHPVRGVQASYSTTSTSYVQYTPLSLTTTHARIRRIVVSASANARWYVNVGGNRVLDSTWGITSIDFNPPVETYRVDLFLASADGANATASITIIYDEVSGRL